MQLKKNHPIFTTHTQIADYIAPLKKHKIKHFTYRKIYYNNECVILGNRPDWLENYFSKKFYLQDNTEICIQPSQKMVALWSALPNQSIFKLAKEWDIDHGMYIMYPSDNGCEVYSFATSKEHRSVINFYLNNLDVMEYFCKQFKAQFKSELQKSELFKISIPANPKAPNLYDMSDVRDTIQYGLLNLMADKFSLSSKKIKCIQQLLNGATAKEIALHLNLSHRTIEDYIEGIRIKFGARNKADLIIKILKYLNISRN